jgi:quinol-cytochrome oxidoreductase complex cytochrome b subunit
MVAYIPVVGTWLQMVIRGGDEVGPTTLSIFYTFHIAIMPICLFLLMPFHFWRVRRAGGVVVPRSSKGDPEKEGRNISTIPNLVLRELVVALVLIAFILVYSLIFDAPLESKANPGLSPNPTKAPWYFAGIQELLLHFHPLFAVWIVPMLIIASLIAWPYFTYDSNRARSIL